MPRDTTAMPPTGSTVADMGAPPPPPGAMPPGLMEEPPQGAGAGVPPMGPAVEPMPNAGEQEAAGAQLELVMRQLEQLLPVFGSTSEIGKGILAAIKSIGKPLSPSGKTQDLQSAALFNSFKAMPQQMQQGVMSQSQNLAPPLAAGAPVPPGVLPPVTTGMMGA